MLSGTPPRYATWADMTAPIRRGDDGWRVYALQTGLNSGLAFDGVFGLATEAAVKQFQQQHKLAVDGVAGPVTQRRILVLEGHATARAVTGIPDGLMRGFAEGEGANLLAATNWTVPGGVDCGCMQIRAYGPPFERAVLRTAFDPGEAMRHSAQQLITRAQEFEIAAWVRRQGAGRREWSLRCAVLAHNWPAGAAAVARTGTCSSPDAPASWVPAGARFPDGAPVRTRREWCQFYALGGPHGDGAITRYVTGWG